MEPQTKILVVEDDDAIASLYEAMLSTEGFAVVRAATGPEGLQKAKEEAPDLILLDLLLPEMSGIDVLRELRESGPPHAEVPVIVLTNLDEEWALGQARVFGATDYLVKVKTTPSEVVGRVREILAQRPATATA